MSRGIDGVEVRVVKQGVVSAGLRDTEKVVVACTDQRCSDSWVCQRGKNRTKWACRACLDRFTQFPLMQFSLKLFLFVRVSSC